MKILYFRKNKKLYDKILLNLKLKCKIIKMQSHHKTKQIMNIYIMKIQILKIK